MIAHNGTKVLESKEFKDLMVKLCLPLSHSIESFILRCGIESDSVYIDEKLVKTISHKNNVGTWHAEEYKTLCKSIGSINIKSSRIEMLKIERSSAVTMAVEYIVGEA